MNRELDKVLTLKISDKDAQSALEWLDAFHQINGFIAPNHPLFALREALRRTMMEGVVQKEAKPERNMATAYADLCDWSDPTNSEIHCVLFKGHNGFLAYPHHLPSQSSTKVAQVRPRSTLVKE